MNDNYYSKIISNRRCSFKISRFNKYSYYRKKLLIQIFGICCLINLERIDRRNEIRSNDRNKKMEEKSIAQNESS